MQNIDIDIDKAILENIDIDRAILENIDIDIDKEILENIDINKEILENIDIDIHKEILENIDIDKISNRLEFGITNRATLFMNIIVLSENLTSDQAVGSN